MTEVLHEQILKEKFGQEVNIKLFKYPDILEKARHSWLDGELAQVDLGNQLLEVRTCAKSIITGAGEDSHG